MNKAVWDWFPGHNNRIWPAGVDRAEIDRSFTGNYKIQIKISKVCFSFLVISATELQG